MIFKENLTDRNQTILPLIRNNKSELKEESQQISSNNDKKSYLSRNLTIDINYTDNNRYTFQDNLEKEKNETFENEKESQNKAKTITNSRIMTNNSDNFLAKAKTPFIAKVELENIRSKKDCIYLLEGFLKTNNYNCNYEVTNEQDKIIISFDFEKTALEFAKIIYNEKNKNSLYKNVLVRLKLLPNKIYLKRQQMKNKKRGLSFVSIDKLYNGSSYVKKIKELPKIKGNINFGLKSPFYNVNDYKKNKINSFKVLNSKNHHISRNENNRDIYGYVGYDGLPLKSYEKLKISVLDTHYNPLSNFKLREINKQKWISTSNFKYY